MFIALMSFEMHVPGAESIKDKRRVVRSVKDRLHREHQVSVAEVAFLDSMSVAGLALVLVNRDAAYARSVCDRIAAKLAAWPEGRLGALSTEVVPVASLASEFVDDQGRSLWDESDRREPAPTSEVGDEPKAGPGPEGYFRPQP